MITVNNYNTNKDGHDIEFTGCHDTYQSQRDFTENFETVVYEGYRTSSIYFYNPCRQLPIDLNLKVKALKKDLYKFVAEYCTDSVDETWLKSDLYVEVIDHLQAELSAYKYDVEELAKDYKIAVSFVNDIEILTTKGYGKGDYALVIIDKTQLTKLWGKEPDDLQEMIDHYFWDAPVSAKLEVNGTEYFYDECDLNCYKWERDVFIKQVAKDAGIPESDLESLVPTELSYVT